MRLPWRPVGMWPTSARPWPLECGDAGDGQARHEEGLEDAVVDEVDAAGGLALVVVVVVAAERVPSKLVRVGSSATERKVGRIGLPSSLVKVWPSSSPRWRWPSRRWPRTSWKKTAEARPLRMAGPLKGSVMGATRRASRFFAMARVLSSDGLLVGQVGGFVGLEGLDAEEVHAVGGAGAGDDDEAGDVAGSGDAGAFARRRSSRSRWRPAADWRRRRCRGTAGRGWRSRAGACSQAARSTTSAGAGGRTAVCGCLGAEVGGGVFFLGADLLLGLDLEVAVERAAVAAVGGVPERARDGVAVVGEGERHGGERAVAVVAVGVVLGGAAEADLDVDRCGGGCRWSW